MRAALAAAALLAALLPACVTEDVKAPDRSWSMSGDEPLVIGDQLSPLVAVGTDASGPAADKAAAQLQAQAQQAQAQAQGGEAARTQPAAVAPGQPGLPGTSGPGGARATAAPPVQVEPTEQGKDELLKLLTPATEKDLEPDFLAEAPPSPFHRLGHNVIRGLDGSWSKMYSLKTERSAGVVKMLQSIVPGFPPTPDTPLPPEGRPTEIVKWVLYSDFDQDTTGKLGVHEMLVNPKISDLLVVTAPPEKLLFIDQVLDKLLADLPQVELQVRVVEVNLDDLLEWDAKVGFNKLENPSAPFDPTTNPIDGHFGAGFPILEGGKPTGYGSVFSSFTQGATLSGYLLSLQGVHNGVNVDALLSLLQTIGASELISSPTVTVLNGHRAMINTGSKVPVFSATSVGVTAQITTTFEDTGVIVEMIPFIVNDDVVRIDLSVDVSAVTGEVPIDLAGTEVLTPVISTRSTGTTVHVHSGQVFAVGGLRNRESIETITKVPLLGDIPILGWLFKSRASRVRNTEILFFITPTIRIPSETLVAPIGS